MKVLITGSAGFLGRHFHHTLTEEGHDVTAIDIAANPSLDALALFHADDTPRYDLVLHCAAVAPHRTAIDNRALTVGAGNLELDAALFTWAERARPGRVVYFSSSAAYPVHWQTGSPAFELTEADIDLHNPQEPDAIYGAVKLMGERLAEAYRQAGGHVTVVRPFSGYGSDQAATFPFGAFRDRACRREDPFPIWGTGTQVRDWIHVDDIVAAVLHLAAEGVDGPVNLCTGRGTSMIELARLFTESVGYDPVFQPLPDKPAGVAYRVGDPTLLERFYTPRISLEEGVRRALENA